MKYSGFILLLCFIIPLNIYSQEERKYVRQGVKDYKENEYEKAELNFRKALDLNKSSYEAAYNTGNSLYKQDRADDAVEKYTNLLNSDISEDRKADLFYNLGNTFLKKNEYQKSIEAYKNALRLRPNDEDARHNLAWALAKLEEQEQNQDQNQDQDEDQNEENEDKQDQEQQENPEENQDQKPQPKEDKNLSKEEIEQILQALEEKEQEVREKVDRERAKVRTAPNEKDW